MFFFSYSRVDSEFVLRLADDLRNAGALVWVDQLDILAGERWDEAVERALHTCQGMVLVLSPDAVQSQNFLDEVSFALEEGKQVVPILYRPCEIPFRLRRLQHVDFTGDYRTGLGNLRKVLLPTDADSEQVRLQSQGDLRRSPQPRPSRSFPAGGERSPDSRVAPWRLGVLAAMLGLLYLVAIPETCFGADWVVLSAIVGLPLSVLIKWKRPRNVLWLLLPAVSVLAGLPYGHAYGAMSRSALFGLEVGEKCQQMNSDYVVLLALLLAVAVLDHLLIRLNVLRRR